MEHLREYTRQAVTQVKGLLDRNDLPTDLQLHRYMKELVKALAKLTADAPESLRREVSRPFAGLWDFEKNTAVWATSLRVEHLVYVLQELEALVLAGREVMGEVAIREINHDIRHILAHSTFRQLEREFGGKADSLVLVRGVEVHLSLELSPDRNFHRFSWWFRHGDREVQESSFFWDEDFDYGMPGDEDDSDEEIVDAESDDHLETQAAQGQLPREAVRMQTRSRGRAAVPRSGSAAGRGGHRVSSRGAAARKRGAGYGGRGGRSAAGRRRGR
mmetsp:Transcript_25926/g.47485  ORF Transcript_25926/g.47485 Transcript_25926/m.47485 type:complete len:274 (+) Transcript_25926:103-924(+)